MQTPADILFLMVDTVSNPDIQFRLRRFWGVAAFSLGILWGLASLVDIPVVALTTIRGSSYTEVGIITAGGILVFSTSIWAFYRRRSASILLLLGGVVLLAAALALPYIPQARTNGLSNTFLAIASGAVAILLGLYGIVTDVCGWPALRGKEPQHHS